MLVLVTGATGFIGAHIVDVLLAKKYNVRATTRSQAKADAMLAARNNNPLLSFVTVSDFSDGADFSEAVRDVDWIIHTASPMTYEIKDAEKELILPAIEGVTALLRAAAASPTVKRIVMTSSFASVMNDGRSKDTYFEYTSEDWNPITYEESIAPTTLPHIAYRGSKKYAELAAWDFVKKEKPQFDLVTLCPPMTFGPMVHPVTKASLNESNNQLYKVSQGGELPVARVPFWIDVRDLAEMHVASLEKREVGGKRFVPASRERFTYAKAAQSLGMTVADQFVDESHGIDDEARKTLGVGYRGFADCVKELIAQIEKM